MKLSSETLSPTELTIITNLCCLDWEFKTAHTGYYTHRCHPYSAKYIPQIPNLLISNFTKKNDLVLDNFVGSGTTLVESKLLGRKAIGVDINPLACLISKVKTTIIEKSSRDQISEFLVSLRDDILHLRGSITVSGFKEKILDMDDPFLKALHNNIPKWYHENVIYELLTIKSKIDIIENNDVKDFLLVAFSSILRNVSNATSGYGNLMINKNAPTKNKVYEKFSRAVTYMLQSTSEFSLAATKSDISVVNQDSRRLQFINDETIDFICTHPPYMAAVPYAEYQKLSLWWLGYCQDKLEKSLIGGRRSRDDTPERYFDDMGVSLTEMKRVLRKEKYCCITIGNPVYHGKIWRLNDFIKKDAKKIGFKLLKEIRRGKYHSTMGKMKEEFIIVFKNE
jgi:site-specific DNA-methyltransferase (cytosine-N4-specific)